MKFSKWLIIKENENNEELINQWFAAFEREIDAIFKQLERVLYRTIQAYQNRAPQQVSHSIALGKMLSEAAEKYPNFAYVVSEILREAEEVAFKTKGPIARGELTPTFQSGTRTAYKASDVLNTYKQRILDLARELQQNVSRLQTPPTAAPGGLTKADVEAMLGKHLGQFKPPSALSGSELEDILGKHFGQFGGEFGEKLKGHTKKITQALGQKTLKPEQIDPARDMLYALFNVAKQINWQTDQELSLIDPNGKPIPIPTKDTKLEKWADTVIKVAQEEGTNFELPFINKKGEPDNIPFDLNAAAATLSEIPVRLKGAAVKKGRPPRIRTGPYTLQKRVLPPEVYDKLVELAKEGKEPKEIKPILDRMLKDMTRETKKGPVPEKPVSIDYIKKAIAAMGEIRKGAETGFRRERPPTEAPRPSAGLKDVPTVQLTPPEE